MDRVNFQGKKLLLLGSNIGAVDIVRYAKEHGAYTIVTDYLSVERSAAKQYADEYLSVSTADLPALSKLITERHIDGILAGISEFNLCNAMALAKQHALPFYCTRAQWDSVENKEQFRALCRQSGVPCPETYYTGVSVPASLFDTLPYPVVVKPVDASSSMGVHICENAAALREAQSDALSHSAAGRLIVEQFVRGQEFTAHYTVTNGIPTLSCMDNRYPVAVHAGHVTTVPIARIYPSLFLEEYIDTVNPAMLRLCESTGMQDGILFIQGMYHPEDGFSVFEAGLRCAGEAPYRFLSRVNGINPIHVPVEHALLGKSVSFVREREDPRLGGKCCGIVSFVTRGGKVGAILGLEEAVAATPSVVEHECRYPVGSETPCGDTLRQLMIRFVMICDSRESMARDIAYLNEHITVLNDRGEDMVIKMDPNRVFGIE